MTSRSPALSSPLRCRCTAEGRGRRGRAQLLDGCRGRPVALHGRDELATDRGHHHGSSMADGHQVRRGRGTSWRVEVLVGHGVHEPVLPVAVDGRDRRPGGPVGVVDRTRGGGSAQLAHERRGVGSRPHHDQGLAGLELRSGLHQVPRLPRALEGRVRGLSSRAGLVRPVGLLPGAEVAVGRRSLVRKLRSAGIVVGPAAGESSSALSWPWWWVGRWWW